MPDNFPRSLCLLVSALLTLSQPGVGKTIVFYEKSFPAVENGSISREALERALSSLHPRFVDLTELERSDLLETGDLLVLPYGSAFPADAWATLRQHLDRGNLLVLGGRPFSVPVRRDNGGWRTGELQNTFSKSLGIYYSYVAPQGGPWKLVWDEDAPWFHQRHLDPQRVFVNAGYGGRYRGLGFLVDDAGNRLAAPVVAEDFVGYAAPPRRRVYLSFEADGKFWGSEEGFEMIRESALYASFGGFRIWLNLQELALDRGQRVSGVVDVTRGGRPARLTVELLSGEETLATRTIPCGDALHEAISLGPTLREPGLYRVRATLSFGDTAIERYTSGVLVRDPALLLSGQRLEAGRDYFRVGGKPYLMVGANYFSTDPYTNDFFVSGSLGGNAWVWDRDFAEMERLGLSAVRTGIWLNRARYLDQVTGAPEERFLRAMEAFLSAAARHHLQVIFTFFAFNPQVEMQAGHGQEGDRLAPGSNPYLDPVAIDAQLNYVRAIVSRFHDVPFLSYDLINEPSFADPKRIWKGNSPNGDPKELAAWQQWLRKRYGTLDSLSHAWRTPPAELGSFDRVPVPAAGDLEFARYGNPRTIRAVDFNLFSQAAFAQWADTIIGGIRSTGSRQAVTVGQDEGGVSDRVLSQFWASSRVDYTVNHTWWRDDALLWNSVVAKSLTKPSLIGETGPQPVWEMDGPWRWDDDGGTALLERKLTLAFANAGAGVLHWDWTRTDEFGLMRRDGSQKQWMEILSRIAAFARKAQPFATEATLPDIALVLPQSLQLSTLGTGGIDAQQNAVRALYQYARTTAFAVGEYQLAQMPEAKLIILPSPWVLNGDAWNLLMKRVQSGATLLISGRIDADEHWISDPGRIAGWNAGYAPGALTTREMEVRWPGDSAWLSFSHERTTYAERGFLKGGATSLTIPLGSGRILYFAPPLELADQLDAIGRIYRYAMGLAGVRPSFETSSHDPGILIAPTRLTDATLYVLTSESDDAGPQTLRDVTSGAEYRVTLPPGRAALLLVGHDGTMLACSHGDWVTRVRQ